MMKNYTVTGMTCEHCVSSVQEEVSSVNGVQQVNVALADGRMTVVGEDFSDESIANAVAEAGYSIQ